MTYSTFALLSRLIEFGQGWIRMMRILHYDKMDNVKTFYFYLKGAGHKIDPEMMYSNCKKYEKEDLFYFNENEYKNT